jgi:hypothetical protein
MIYPGANFNEISLLPSGIYAAVKHYRQKVLKEQDRRVYLSVKSSFLDWHETDDEMDSLNNYPAYHFIKLGMLRRKDVMPCTKVKDDLASNLHTELPKLRAQTFRFIVSKLRTLFKDSRIRVNFKSLHVFLYTEALQPVSEQDCIKIQDFEAQFYGNDLEVSISTKKHFCQYASRDHKCDLCLECRVQMDPEDTEDDKVSHCSTASSSDNNM